MDLSRASIGVWFNGNEHLYIRKVVRTDKTTEYLQIPNIPKYGQRLEDIGFYKRKDLRAPSNLKATFKDIRNHLAGNATGIARDEAFAQEIINLLFCKIIDEQDTAPEDVVEFRAGLDESAAKVKNRIETLFEKVKTKAFGDVFTASDEIKLDADSVLYVVGELQNYCVMDADRDAIGDAFEVFIGPALRGAEGQFFTPRNVVKMIVGMLNPQPGERIIDPSCGSGGFLITALEHVWAEVKAESYKKRWTERQRYQRETQVATDCFRGIDKDAFLAKVCKAYMALIGDGKGGIFCENTLAPTEDWGNATRVKVQLGTFDVVLTNPPFGSKIAIKGTNILSQYDLARKWTKDKNTGKFLKSAVIEPQRPPQILFLERCFQLLKPSGRMGIILPESMISNPSYEFVIDYIRTHAKIIAIVALPESLFKTSGKGGTHTKVAALFLQKGATSEAENVFMSDVKWCGHDSRGNQTKRRDTLTGIETVLDEVPFVQSRYALARQATDFQGDHLGYNLPLKDIKHNIFVPKYYDPEIDQVLEKLQETHEIVSFSELVAFGYVAIRTGAEPGKMAYGTGDIPFIRTSDLSNWEIKADFKHGVSEDIYVGHKSKCDVVAGDILMVRDGTYLIGTSAIVTEHDLPMLYQSHLFRIRAIKPDLLSSWLLFACLNSPIVKRQIRAKQFTQDIIDTLGKRIGELKIPFPRQEHLAVQIEVDVKQIIEVRSEMREKARGVALSVQGIGTPDVEDMEAVKEI